MPMLEAEHGQLKVKHHVGSGVVRILGPSMRWVLSIDIAIDLYEALRVVIEAYKKSELPDELEFKDLAKLMEGRLRRGLALTDEEFDKLYPDWDETMKDIAEEMAKRRGGR